LQAGRREGGGSDFGATGKRYLKKKGLLSSPPNPGDRRSERARRGGGEKLFSEGTQKKIFEKKGAHLGKNGYNILKRRESAQPFKKKSLGKLKVLFTSSPRILRFWRREGGGETTVLPKEGNFRGPT